MHTPDPPIPLVPSISADMLTSAPLTMTNVAHALVEHCYKKAKRLAHSGNYVQADHWRMLAQQLTAAESFARHSGL